MHRNQSGIEPGPWSQQLQSSEDRFRTIFECSNDAIFVVDLEREVYLDVNAKACAMLGFAREELLAMTVAEVHPHDMPQVRAFTQLVMEQGWGTTSELTCISKDGSFLPADVSAAIIDLDGRHAMIVSVRDLSERERLARERDYLRERMQCEQGSCPLVGSSAPLQKVCEEIGRVAPTDASVL